MVNHFGHAVIAISSVSRMYYQQNAVNRTPDLSLSSLKESGGLEYLFELVFGVDGDEKSLNLNTLKNRFGKKGVVHLKRDARHSYLSDGEKSVR